MRKETLRCITSIETLYKFVCADIPQRFTREMCTRMDELDADWLLRLDDAAVKALVQVVARNRADEKFDMQHIGSALKKIYTNGRLKTEIEALRGKAVAHSDHHGKEYRHKSCHYDEGYTYLELDKI